MDNISIIKKSSLFSGIDMNEIELLLNCLSAQNKTYYKGQYIFRSGENISEVGMVLNGSVHVVNEDFWGNRTIISEISASQLFGESYACVQTEPIRFSVIAAEQSNILFLNVTKIMTVCISACEFHNRLVRNLLFVLADKNQILTKKMEHLTKRTTREKLLSYLSMESLKNNNACFDIPFNRQQLADYLSVDRSAMSNELCKLRDEGILIFQKNRFNLNEKTEKYSIP